MTWHELAFGVRRLEKGARRTALELRLRDLASDLPAPLPFSGEAADWLASDLANLTVVTANTKHFVPFLALQVADWSRPSKC